MMDILHKVQCNGDAKCNTMEHNAMETSCKWLGDGDKLQNARQWKWKVQWKCNKQTKNKTLKEVKSLMETW